ncbi:MAG: hypothetical protein H6948_02560 [Zoogloeaceae bacterium]|nr:hypothetical protein [Zoogloeaceae bacterium]
MDKRILDTITRIYAMPGEDRKAWVRALDEINHLIDGDAAALMVINRDDSVMDRIVYAGFPKPVIAAYRGGAEITANDDVRFTYRHRLTPGIAAHDIEFVPTLAEYDESPWIQFQREHAGVHRCVVAKISRHGLWEDFISVNRREQAGMFTENQKRDLQLVMPHLERALELHKTVASLEHRYGAVLGALDMLLIGMIIVDQAGRVCASNAAAKSACDHHGLLTITAKGGLKARSIGANATLQARLQACIHTANARGDHVGGQILLGNGGKHLLIEVMPLRDDNLPDKDGIDGAAVFVFDSSLSQILTLDGLAQLFGLSRAEQRVGSDLLNGLRPEEIAEQRGCKIDTVRKQLKSVFRKTRTHSQLELLRLASKASPPLRRSD